MKSLRAVVSSLALVVALIGVTTAPMYAVQRSPGCAPAATAAHSCCKTPILKTCCSDQSERSNQSGPAPSRVQVNPNLTAAPAIFVADLAPSIRAGLAQHATPRAGPLDLPTLLSTLLL